MSLHVVFVLIPMLYDLHREQPGRILREAAALVEAGTLRPLIDPARFDLATAPDAHHFLESGRAQGKVVIDIA
ncbi:zinc-binding dehydrogenase [Pseudoroseomonas globiformis]|uniref:Zinc-binding dehydrogenase n=1 Tax=Teichococcus globiformis TaxID=2307229 RepID=A0ABV7G051_9PROT